MTAADAQPTEQQGTLPLSFIHVGLGKCASTYLQQLWTADEQYSPLNAVGIVQAVRDAAEKQPDKKMNISPPAASKQTQILSSEGFTWGWINQPAQQEAVSRLKEVSARLLGGSRLSSRLLVMVRNPVDWLRAVHEQSIKEGGYAPFAEFVREQDILCESVLDLTHLLECFRPHFSTIVILSADDLRNNPGRFWRLYSEKLGVSKPSKAAFSAVKNNKHMGNKSLGKRITALASLNRNGAAFREAFLEMKDYPQVWPQEYENYKPIVSGAWVWMNRRLMEFGNDSQIASALAHVDQVEPDGFQTIEVDAGLGQWIEDRFLKPLEDFDTISPDLLADYRSALSKVST